MSTRILWLDLFRGACVVGMIETHVLNTFLATSMRESSWFLAITYFNGLVAPGFLFIAGYVQGLGLRSSADKPRDYGRKLRRLGEVWLLGYALHFPTPQLIGGQWSEALRIGTVVDVLQCIAVSLALLLAIERWMPRWADLMARILTVIVVVFATDARHWRFEPAWLLGYFNGSTGSLFPLLPWAGFVFAGFVASSVVRWRSWEWAWNLALVAIVALIFDGEVAFFAQRLAWLLILVPLAQVLAARWHPAWLLFVGRESLVLYAAHLVLIEILAVTVLARAGFGLLPCAAIFFAVLVASVAVAVLWRRTTGRWPVRSGARPHP